MGPGMLPVVEDRSPSYIPQQQHQGYQQFSQVSCHIAKSCIFCDRERLKARLPLEHTGLPAALQRF